MGDGVRGYKRTLALLPMVFVSACTTWYTQRAPVPEPISSDSRQSEVRLTLKSGALVVMYDVRLIGDSVMGYDRPSTVRSANPVLVAKRDVAYVEIKKGDGVKTFFAVVGGGLAALMLIGVAACASSGI